MSTYNGVKRSNGLRGDGHFIVWSAGILIVAGSGVVIGYSSSFIAKYEDWGNTKLEDYSFAYAAAQFARVYGCITLALTALYVGWVFADGRHHLRKAFKPIMGPARPGEDLNAGLYPTMWTMHQERINRLTSSRLFAQRQHVIKLIAFLALFFIAWLVAALLLAFKGGYVQEQRTRIRGTDKYATIHRVCPSKRARESSICQDLFGAGIASAVVAFLFFVSILASAVTLMMAPKRALANSAALRPPNIAELPG